MAGGYCQIVNCEREAEHGDLCAGHRKRLMRGLNVSEPLAPAAGTISPWQRFEAAILAYAETDSDDDEQYERNCARLRNAGEDWLLSIMGILEGSSTLPANRRQRTQAVMARVAAAVGRLGGLKGGPARARALSKKRRVEIAKLAIAARWRRTLGSSPEFGQGP